MTPVLDGYVPGGFLSTTGGDALLTALDSLADLGTEDQADQVDGTEDLAKVRAGLVSAGRRSAPAGICRSGTTARRR